MENGKLYLGVTLNGYFIGKFNEGENRLDNVWSLNFQKDNKIEIGPSCHPAFLQSKFEEKLNDVNIKVEKFQHIIDPDKIALGESFKNVYTEAVSNIIVGSQTGVNSSEITEKLKQEAQKEQSNLII